MKKPKKTVTRRGFLGTSLAAGAAAAAMPGFSLGAAPKKGGTLTCGVGLLIQTPDVHRHTGTWGRHTTALAFEGLFDLPSPNEVASIVRDKGPDAVPVVKPMLCENYEVEKGGARFVFHLKKGVRFHNGKEFGSDDVKWNWERIANPKVRADARKMKTDFIKAVQTPDQYTVVADMTRPYPAILAANTWCNTPLIAKDSAPFDAPWGAPNFKPQGPGPMGTGPFRWTAFQQKKEAVFERFEDYREPGLPYLDKVVYKVIFESQPRTLSFRAGELDYIYAPETNWMISVLGENPESRFGQVVDVEGKYKVYTNYNPVTYVLFLNSHEDKDTPFKDERVRQAFEYAIDREAAVKAAWSGMARPMYQGYNPEISRWGFEDIKKRKRDVKKARQLLAAAGYPRGIDIELRFTPAWGNIDGFVQIIQQMAREAGFNIKLASAVGMQYFNPMLTYNYQASFFVNMGEDPMASYYSNYHTDPAPPMKGHGFISGIKDARLDQLLDEMAFEIDPAKRRARFRKVVEYVNDKAYVIPMVSTVIADAYSDKVKNFDPRDYYFPNQGFKRAHF